MPSPEPRFPPLSARFASRTAPLAAAIAVLVALVPPLLTAALTSRSARVEARVRAEAISTALEPLVRRQPVVWRYQAHKLSAVALPLLAGGRPSQAELLDCAGRAIAVFGEAATRSASAVVAVEGLRGPVGHVVVSADRSSDTATVWWVALAALACGLPLGALVFTYPLRVVRGLELELRAVGTELATANATLKQQAGALERRVAEAVRENAGLQLRVQHAQDEERERIAQDLHDGVGQLLTAIRFEAAGEASRVPALQRVADRADVALAELRRVVRGLRPALLDRAGLAEALRVLTEQLEERTGAEVAFRHEGPDVDDPMLARAALRVAQEALANVERHARAEVVEVSLRVDDTGIVVCIRDDGCGFDPDEVVRGIGLDGLVSRASLLGGEARVSSAPGGGTTVEVRLPRSPR